MLSETPLAYTPLFPDLYIVPPGDRDLRSDSVHLLHPGGWPQILTALPLSWGCGYACSQPLHALWRQVALGCQSVTWLAFLMPSDLPFVKQVPCFQDILSRTWASGSNIRRTLAKIQRKGEPMPRMPALISRSPPPSVVEGSQESAQLQVGPLEWRCQARASTAVASTAGRDQKCWMHCLGKRI